MLIFYAITAAMAIKNQIDTTTLMGGLRNSNIAFKLFESLVVQPLLHNSASWIGIKEKQI